MGGLPPESKWIPTAEISPKYRMLIKVTLAHPVLCINEHYIHVASLKKCEFLRKPKKTRENVRLKREVTW